jgi:PadR family transcriptional regulator PadR
LWFEANLNLVRAMLRKRRGLPIDIRYIRPLTFAIIDSRYKMSRIELLQGTLDMLILNALRAGSNHGLGISRRIHQITRGTFDVRPGSLYTALHRLEEQGWLTAEWNDSENRRRAKFYELTATGKKQLQAETENWERISLAITRALRAT